ncbi:ABC-2 type transport system permease protein [Catenulispora sp. GAS73]|uniref:ABC transporter permease n=1 Tax=Catenulispora sp. GAS73 TaxID=3156269 RepID=UPI0035178417
MSEVRIPEASTRPGEHTRLEAAAAPALAVAPSGAAPGFDPRRTLPLRVELRRQLKRRRTQVAFGLLAALPLILAAAFKLGSPTRGRGPGTTIDLADLATVGAPNFTLFTLFATSGIALSLMVALFTGDTVASEASWSSLRYLLATPIPRSRLLRQKLIVALGLSAAALVLLPTVALLSGWAVFGWAPARSPLGTSLATGPALAHLAIVVGYLALSLLFVAALGFALSTHTDTPLGAVGGTVMLVILSDILDSVTALGGARAFLPTHYSYAWLDALSPTVSWDAMIRGVVSSFAYSLVFFALVWRRFLRKDITS